MTKKRQIIFTLLAFMVSSACSGWVAADMNDATGAAPMSNDKEGVNSNPTYNKTPSNTDKTTADTKAPLEAKTVPSGKRHRTHVKHGTQGDSADAYKTINSGDVTPSR